MFPRITDLSKTSLRFQLSATMTGVVAGCLLFVVLGTNIFVLWGEYRFYFSLSEQARHAYLLEWSETGMPREDLVKEISIAEETILQPVYEDAPAVMVLLSIVAALLSTLVALWLAKKLTVPLEKASHSARVMAEGNLDHRISIPGHSALEVTSLADSFTHLAESLQNMEQDVRFTSAAIAHEIRTPLTVIRGYLQGIRDGVFEADDERLDTMLQRMDSLGRLIDDLQTLSLAQSGRLSLKIAPAHLRQRLRDLVLWVNTQHVEGKVSFEPTGEADSEPALNVDAERIEQVVLGLIDNALRYSGDSGRVRVAYAQTANEAIITVQDNGPGFSDEALAKADERFWRDESSRSRETGGSGLGLALAAALIQAHGGHIVLANRPEGGGSVGIHLPG